MVRREAHAMDENLAFVKWAEIVRRGIAEADDADQRVARRIDHGNRVGELIGCVDAVMRADRHVGWSKGACPASAWGVGSVGDETAWQQCPARYGQVARCGRSGAPLRTYR